MPSGMWNIRISWFWFWQKIGQGSLAHTLRFEWKAAESDEIYEMVLKVLSSEMNPSEIRFIKSVVIKEWGAEIKKKPAPHAVRAV